MTIHYTYIILTSSMEFYCGVTNNIKKRFDEHIFGVFPQWFSNDARRNFKLAVKLKGNYKKEIKRFGIEKFYQMLIKNKMAVSLS